MTFVIKGEAGVLKGSMMVPGDKSIAHRAILFAALAEGVSVFRGFPRGADNLSTISAVRALGCKVEEVEDRIEVYGKGREALRAPKEPIDCGNSGTTARLLAGLLAGSNIEATLVGDESLTRRPMERIAAPLRTMGAKIDTSAPGGTLPMVIHRAPIRNNRIELTVASAQVKSAVLLAGLGAKGRTEVEEPFPSRDHTERMFAEMGADIEYRPCHAALEGPVESLKPLSIQIPGDPSSAAFFVCLAAMIPKSEVQILGVLDNPGRSGYLKILERMGAKIQKKNLRSVGGEPVIDLVVHGGELKCTDINAPEVPSCIDEIPILSVVMTQADGQSTVSGARELRVKEADRITGMLEGLSKMGVECDEFEDGFTISGPNPLLSAELNGLGDHRLVMSFAIAAVLAKGESTIKDASAVAISFPGFASALQQLGVQITQS